MDHKDRGVGGKEGEMREVVGSPGSIHKSTVMRVSRSRQPLRDTQRVGRKVCEPPKGQASHQAGREMLENRASFPLLFWNAQFFYLHDLILYISVQYFRSLSSFKDDKFFFK